MVSSYHEGSRFVWVVDLVHLKGRRKGRRGRDSDRFSSMLLSSASSRVIKIDWILNNMEIWREIKDTQWKNGKNLGKALCLSFTYDDRQTQVICRPVSLQQRTSITYGEWLWDRRCKVLFGSYFAWRFCAGFFQYLSASLLAQWFAVVFSGRFTHVGNGSWAEAAIGHALCTFPQSDEGFLPYAMYFAMDSLRPSRKMRRLATANGKVVSNTVSQACMSLTAKKHFGWLALACDSEWNEVVGL